MKKPYLISGIILAIFLSLFVFQKINLTTADIGRHIINGKILLDPNSSLSIKQSLLHTNFFSYTNSEFPFVNHHWGSGILSCLVYLIFGFSGLGLIYGLFIILSVFLLFSIWKDKLSILVSFPIVLFLIPLISDRTEVRPEALSYFFLAIIIAISYLYTSDQILKKWTYLIPVISLIWVNIHIYFIFAPFVVGMFLIENFIKKDFEKSKHLFFILVITSIILCINPYGIIGVIYPFIMFGNYGYLVVENQSIPFLTRLNIFDPNYMWWVISTLIFTITSALILWKKRTKFPYALSGITLVFAVLSFLGVRHLTAYGLSLIPTLLLFGFILYKKPDNEKQKKLHMVYSTTATIIIIISILFFFNSKLPWNRNWGVGLMPEVNASAEFVKSKNISGPIFSNYDIGGYLIFHMYPKEKVFVDNRPEGYPTSFFQNEYIPMQENDSVWNKELIKWNFNIIWFNRNDLTPWSQQFLVTRIQDPEWAPVFVDSYTIIFLLRNEKNAKLIEQFELPKSMFTVR